MAWLSSPVRSDLRVLRTRHGVGWPLRSPSSCAASVAGSARPRGTPAPVRRPPVRVAEVLGDRRIRPSRPAQRRGRRSRSLAIRPTSSQCYARRTPRPWAYHSDAMRSGASASRDSRGILGVLTFNTTQQHRTGWPLMKGASAVSRRQPIGSMFLLQQLPLLPEKLPDPLQRLFGRLRARYSHT